jgi:capsule polysaccharide export protein KpsC/LpsZ
MKIALATSGMRPLKPAIELLTGGQVRRSWPFGFGMDAIAGWGHKPTSLRARKLARKSGLPYLAFEDGFLRSVFPGNGELPLSLVLDRTGIYYDARLPSDLEAYICRRNIAAVDLAQARDAMSLLRNRRLSKYNNFSLDDISALSLRTSNRSSCVLVVDQTEGDASIEGAMASAETFHIALEAAVEENPQAEILVRVHPETMTGRKRGHFSAENLERLAASKPSIRKALASQRIRLTPEPIAPWILLEACGKVYCVSSQLGFEGLMADCEVNCFGMPFYGGWGLTRDRGAAAPERRKPARIEAVFAAVYFDYCNYIDHADMRTIGFHEALDILGNAVCRARETA